MMLLCVFKFNNQQLHLFNFDLFNKILFSLNQMFSQKQSNPFAQKNNLKSLHIVFMLYLVSLWIAEIIFMCVQIS